MMHRCRRAFGFERRILSVMAQKGEHKIRTRAKASGYDSEKRRGYLKNKNRPRSDTFTLLDHEGTHRTTCYPRHFLQPPPPPSPRSAIVLHVYKAEGPRSTTFKGPNSSTLPRNTFKLTSCSHFKLRGAISDNEAMCQ